MQLGRDLLAPLLMCATCARSNERRGNVCGPSQAVVDAHCMAVCAQCTQRFDPFVTDSATAALAISLVLRSFGEALDCGLQAAVWMDHHWKRSG
jgi:hypothetical protein